MKLNRRNALFALGTIAAGSGTALATGAFSSVSADRTVMINTASDDEGVLSLEIIGDYRGLTDGGDADIIKLDFNQINQTAITTFKNALRIKNNGSNEVELKIKTDDGDLSEILKFIPSPTNLKPDDAVELTITVDFKEAALPEDPWNEEITIEAAKIDD